MDRFCYLCFMFVMFFVVSSPAGKGLVTWLPCMCILYCVFVISPCGVLGQMCYLILSISDLCLLSYFVVRLNLEI